jgi:threonine dehydrogenase-like Zn-dependent dehydrogenase
MKALVVTAPDTFAWTEVEPPRPAADEALVRIEVCGFCGSTDRELIAGTQPYRPPFPFLLGHEAVGEVIEVGADVTDYRVGDRVTRATCCSAHGPRADGLHSGWGGFAELGLVQQGAADYTAQRQIVLPPGLPADQAFMAIALAETRAFVEQMAEATRPVAGRATVVVGTGIAGLTLAYWAKVAGAEPVITLGRRAERLALACRGGADHALNLAEPNLVARIADLTGGRGAELLLEAVGKPAVLAGLGPLLAPGAVVGVYGAADAEAYAAAKAALPADAVVLQPGPEEHRYTRQVAEELLAGNLPVDLWRTHVWPREAFAEAVAAVDRGEVVKGCVRL